MKKEEEEIVRGLVTPGVVVDGRKLWAAMEAHREEQMVLLKRYIPWSEVAKVIGMAPSGLTRLSCGGKPSTDVFVRAMLWMGEFDVRRFVKEGSDE